MANGAFRVEGTPIDTTASPLSISPSSLLTEIQPLVIAAATPVVNASGWEDAFMVYNALHMKQLHGEVERKVCSRWKSDISLRG